MKFQREYQLNWTYHFLHSDHCYSEWKCFNTELERNKFALDLFTQHKQKKIVLVWLEESDIKTWKNNA